MISLVVLRTTHLCICLHICSVDLPCHFPDSPLPSSRGTFAFPPKIYRISPSHSHIWYEIAKWKNKCPSSTAVLQAATMHADQTWHDLCTLLALLYKLYPLVAFRPTLPVIALPQLCLPYLYCQRTVARPRFRSMPKIWAAKSWGQIAIALHAGVMPIYIWVNTQDVPWVLTSIVLLYVA